MLGVAQRGVVTPHRAYLQLATALGRQLRELDRLRTVDRRRLLDQHVQAGLERLRADALMKAIGDGDEHRIEVFAQQFGSVGITRHPVARADRGCERRSSDR